MKLEIPARPERPTDIALYSGPTPDLSAYWGSSAHTWKAKASENSGKAGLLTNTDFDTIPATDSKNANRIGYLIASNDNTSTTV